MPIKKKKITPSQLYDAIEAELSKLLRFTQNDAQLKRLGPKSPWTVEVQLVTAPVMKTANRTFRGKSYATDVLSFPAPPIFRKEGRLGDLLICLPVLRAQANEHAHTEFDELSVLLVHGVLHLLGFDHEKSSKDAKAMAAWEKKLLQTKGLIHRVRSGTKIP